MPLSQSCVWHCWSRKLGRPGGQGVCSQTACSTLAPRQGRPRGPGLQGRVGDEETRPTLGPWIRNLGDRAVLQVGIDTYGGWSHFLWRKRAPVPQVRLHRLQALQGLQSPSAWSGSGVLLTHSPARHHCKTVLAARRGTGRGPGHSSPGDTYTGLNENSDLWPCSITLPI